MSPYARLRRVDAVAAMIAEAIWLPVAVKFHYRRAIPKQLIARGKRRTFWAGPRTPLNESVSRTVGVP